MIDMSTFYKTPLRSDELYHYGRKGMKWYQHIYGKVNSSSSGRYSYGSSDSRENRMSLFKRYDDSDIRKYQRQDGSLTRTGKKKQAVRDADLSRLQTARKDERDRLNYYRSFNTASDNEVYRNVKRDIEYGDYTETFRSFTKSKKSIDAARKTYIRLIPDQEKKVNDLDKWIDRHQRTPLNELTPLEQIRKRNKAKRRQEEERRRRRR